MQGPVAIILAAGQGNRMRSEKAKVLHELCGRPMIAYVVDAARQAGARSIIVVVGYGGDQVRDALPNEPDVHFVEQTDRRGTGHAVKCCRPLLDSYAGPALILVGDEPLMRPEPLADLLARQAEDQAACLLGTAQVDDPTGFGRILRDTAGHFLRIVEQKDCDPDEALIREINPSCYVFELPLLWTALDRLTTQNQQHEEYLTDAPAILQGMGHKVRALPVLDPREILGVNTRHHLAEAHALMQARIQDRLLLDGVGIIDPRNTYIDGRAEIGSDTVILPFTVIQGRVTIGRNCRIGPFTHLRDGTRLDDGVEIGAFVEVSQSHVQEHARARHLAYLGNSEVGPHANIGAGAITANFDGHKKHATQIGPNASIGAGSILIAPISIGGGAVVGAGTVLTKRRDVPAGQTVVGVPARVLETRSSE